MQMNVLSYAATAMELGLKIFNRPLVARFSTKFNTISNI